MKIDLKAFQLRVLIDILDMAIDKDDMSNKIYSEELENLYSKFSIAMKATKDEESVNDRLLLFIDELMTIISREADVKPVWEEINKLEDKYKLSGVLL